MNRLLLLALLVMASSVFASDLRVRSARVMLVDGRWVLDEDANRVEDLVAPAVNLVRTRPSDEFPRMSVQVTVPGFLKGAGAAPYRRAETVQIGSFRDGDRLEVVGRESIQIGSGMRMTSSSSSSNHNWILGFAYSPELANRGLKRPDYFRNEFSLVVIERADAESAGDWSLEDWIAVAAGNLSQLAAESRKLSYKLRERIDLLPIETAAWQTDRSRAVHALATLGMAVPYPASSFDDLRALQLSFAQWFAAGSGQPNETLRLARFMAGDERVMKGDGWRAWASSAESDTMRYLMKPGGQFWARAAMLSPSARCREEALAILQGSEVSTEVAGDLLDATRAGTFDAPPWLVTRLDDGPTDVRTFFGSLLRNWYWSLAAMALLAGALVALSRVAVSNRAAAWAIILGVWLLTFDLWSAGFDILPDWFGALLLLGGSLGLARGSDAGVARRLPIYSATALLAVLLAYVAPTWPILRIASALFVLLLLIEGAFWSRRLEQRKMPFLFLALYVLPATVMIVFALGDALGLRMQITVNVRSTIGALMMLAMGIAALWASLQFLSIARFRDTQAYPLRLPE